jgi:hypothetical protein
MAGLTKLSEEYIALFQEDGGSRFLCNVTIRKSAKYHKSRDHNTQPLSIQL